jgi:WD40 repeat protein
MAWLALAGPAAMAQGNGHGNGGGGGGGGGQGGGGEPPSPADPAIAFVGGSNQMLGVMDADATNVTALGIEGTGFPAWSPDLDGDDSNGYQGSLVYAHDLGSDSVLEVVDVRVVDGVAVGANARQVAPSFAVLPSWSPDLDPVTPGYQGAIAFTDFQSVYTVEIAWDGATATPSTIHSETINTLVAENGIVFSPTFDPDGTRLVYGWTDNVTSDIRLVDLATLQVSVIEQSYGWPGDFDWSRDSSMVAYSVEGDVRLLDPDVFGSSVSLGVSGRSPSFSADDGALVFQGGSGQRQSLRRLDLASGEVNTLLKDKKEDVLWPDWRE